MTLRLRALTDDERTEVQRITRSHTLGAAFVRRAQIVVHAMSGLKAEEIARRMELCGGSLLDQPLQRTRAGRGRAHRTTTDLFGRAAQCRHHRGPDPARRVGVALCLLDRLVAYLSDQGIAMRRSRISEIFIREGLKWHHDETWFGERVDPDFAKKRGSSSSSTPRRRSAA